uniref:tRNA modification GTPase MnmE n=1 Tax=Lygus hesperus TaxID=30085 RepID=A0A0A9ZEU8_LYGHE
MHILKSDLVIAASKDAIDHFQNEFSDTAKELTDSMRHIRERRDDNDIAYHMALQEYNTSNTSASRRLIKAFERKMKLYISKKIAPSMATEQAPLDADTAA